MTNTDCLTLLPPQGRSLQRYTLYCSHSHPLCPTPVCLLCTQIPQNTCIFFPHLLPNTQNTSVFSICWDQMHSRFPVKKWTLWNWVFGSLASRKRHPHFRANIVALYNQIMVDIFQTLIICVWNPNIEKRKVNRPKQQAKVLFDAYLLLRYETLWAWWELFVSAA